MRIAAKGLLPSGYHGLGRYWPRDVQVELDVSPEEYRQILADSHIVCVVIPEYKPPAQPSSSKSLSKGH